MTVMDVRDAIRAHHVGDTRLRRLYAGETDGELATGPNVFCAPADRSATEGAGPIDPGCVKPACAFCANAAAAHAIPIPCRERNQRRRASYSAAFWIIASAIAAASSVML